MGKDGAANADHTRRRALSTDREEAGAGRLIDSHAHLLHLKSPLTPESALEEARAVGVKAVINIGNDASDNQAGIELTERIPGLRTTVGWHPHVAAEPLTADQRRELRHQVAHPNVVAVGEIGLDYHFTDHHRVPAKQQARAFRDMLALSQEAGKPVVLHTREAFAELLGILDEFPGTSGVFHCFSGNAAIATEALARGFFISFAATVTYPNAHHVVGAAAIVPLDHMLVETDSPFLPPQSRRGKPNAPAFIPETVAFIAGSRGTSVEAVAHATRSNAIQLFHLPADRQ